jgi:hypothetical protein
MAGLFCGVVERRAGYASWQNTRHVSSAIPKLEPLLESIGHENVARKVKQGQEDKWRPAKASGGAVEGIVAQRVHVASGISVRINDIQCSSTI